MADEPPLDFGIDLDTVRDRLMLMGHFLTVTDVQAAAEAMEQAIARPPAAFVSIQSDTAQPNRLIGGYRQRCDVILSVVAVERAARIAGDTRDAVERVRKAVMRQLTRWTPGGAGAALEYDRSFLKAISNGFVFVEVLFRTHYFLGVPPVDPPTVDYIWTEFDL